MHVNYLLEPGKNSTGRNMGDSETMNNVRRCLREEEESQVVKMQLYPSDAFFS